MNSFVNNVDMPTLCVYAGTFLILAIVCAVSSKSLERTDEADADAKALELETSVELGGKKKLSLRSALLGAGLVPSFAGALCAILAFGVSQARKSSAYVEKPWYVEHVDNHGIFGTGYGGIDTPTPVTEPVTGIVLDENGNETSIRGSVSSTVVTPKDPTQGTPVEPNDTPEAGPYVPPVNP